MNLTFLIPIRIDSKERLENLIMTVDFIKAHFDCNITILEADNINNGIISRLLGDKAKYSFIEDFDPVFYRTKYINIMTRNTETDFLAIWDADIIIPPNQIIEAYTSLCNESFDIAYPYDGHFYDTSIILRELFYKNRSLDFLSDNIEKMGLIYGTKCRGGAILVNKASYIKSGLENEQFYGWGPEDFERYNRWVNLDFKINIVKGPLFHLTHTRGINSTFRSMEQSINTNLELLKTKMSSKEELLALHSPNK